MTLRRQRLADELRDLLALMFQGGRLDDPRLHTVTISAVKLSADLQLASVYFRVYPGSDPVTSRTALGRAAGLLRHQLAQHLKLRRVPELRFFYDESIERGAKIEELINVIHNQ